MFCRYCGKNIDDNLTVCPYCGIPTTGPYIPQKPKDEPFSEFNNAMGEQPAHETGKGGENPAEETVNGGQTVVEETAAQEPQKRMLVNNPELNNQALQNGAPQAQPQVQKKATNGFAIAGFVIALVGIFLDIIMISCEQASLGSVYVVALILSIVGTVKSKTLGTGKGFGIAGIVISAICLAFWAIVIFIAILVVLGLAMSCAQM